MRTTLFFKRADLLLQLAALLIPLIIGLFGNRADILITYFTVGMVQLLSCLLNRLFLKDLLRHDGRIGCEIAALLLVASFAVLPIADTMPAIVSDVYVFTLLVGGPVLAIWYAIVSCREMRQAFMMVDRKQYL